jgi:hypothetical protein
MRHAHGRSEKIRVDAVHGDHLVAGPVQSEDLHPVDAVFEFVGTRPARCDIATITAETTDQGHTQGVFAMQDVDTSHVVQLRA